MTELNEMSFRAEREIFHTFTLKLGITRLSKHYYVYIMSNWNNGVIYTGMTDNLKRRVYEHKSKLIHGFTQRYNCTKLVCFEETSDVRAAISREKEIKKWRREKKNKLIESKNPDWKDLGNLIGL